MPRTKRIRTVLYGDERVTPGELQLLHTASLQRLYDLHQLGFTDRVFIDASHSRLHHVVGVVEQADKLCEAIIRNLRESPERKWLFGKQQRDDTVTCAALADLVEDVKPVVRLMGLLHDLTHAPFGHTVEDEIELLESTHDEPDRQAEAFYRLLCELIGWLAIEGGVHDNAASLGFGMPESLVRFLADPTITHCCPN